MIAKKHTPEEINEAVDMIWRICDKIRLTEDAVNKLRAAMVTMAEAVERMQCVIERAALRGEV